MQNGFEKNKPSISQEELKRLLQSPEAQKLLALLNRDGGKTLQKASEAASRGEYDAVKELLSPKLQTKEAQALLQSLDRKA